MARFDIHHPKADRKLKTNWFVAFGPKPKPNSKVTVTLTADDGTVQPGSELTLKCSGNSLQKLWVVLFKDLQEKKPDQTDVLYTLKITADGEQPVSHAKIRVTRRAAFGPVINYPTPNDYPVSTSFVTYGTCSGNSPSSTMTEPAETQQNGDQLQTAEGTFAFAFGDQTPLNPHSDWTLTVKDSSPQPTALTNVDVKSV